MTDEDIKVMLKDIIDNGAEYEIYKQPCHIKKGNTKCIHTNLTCPECINKHSVKEKYKLGEEIHSDWEYRKVENWSVIEWEDTHKFEIRTLKDAEDIIGAFIQITFKTKEECEKWIEEHTKKSWLKERAEENYTKVYLNGDMSLNTEEKYFAYTKGYCKGYTDGLAEGRKEKQWIATEKAQKKTSAKIKELKKENKICEEIIIGEQQEINDLQKENAELENKLNESNELCNKQALRISELEAQIEEMKCCKNIYAVSDKNSNSVPCYTIYNCRNCHRKG